MRRNKLTEPKTFDTTGRRKVTTILEPGIRVGQVITGNTPLAGRTITSIHTSTAKAHRAQAVASDIIYLVACVAKKRVSNYMAQDLYISEWFKKARAYVESKGKPWFILSAHYGLLRPTETIKPYNQSLNAMSTRERKEWAHNVWRQFQNASLKPQEVVILAGEHYREGLLPYLHEAQITVTVPMYGLPIGKQLAWLKQATQAQINRRQPTPFF